MTTPTLDVVQSWARGAISTGPCATTEQKRVAALRLVRTSEFAPPADDAVAIGIALGRPRDPVDAFVRETCFSRDEDNLSREIEEFSQAFFNLPCAERGRRWRELSEWASAFPWWRARLDHLRRGLDVERPAYPQGIVKTTFEAFVLCATERAARRRDAIDEIGEQFVDNDIRELERTDPEIARLAKDVFSGVRSQPAPRRSRTTSRAKVARARYEPQREAPAPQPPKDSWNSWWTGGVLVVLLAIVRFATMGSSTTRHEPPVFPQQRFQQPNFQPRPDPRFDDLNKQIEEMRKRHEKGENVPVGKGMRILMGVDDKDKK